jgi:Cu2+-exporting ATPase
MIAQLTKSERQLALVILLAVTICGLAMGMRVGAVVYRLGRPEWALAEDNRLVVGDASVVLSQDGRRLADFRFEDRLRAGATQAVTELKRGGFDIDIVSGDRERPVHLLATELGVSYFAGMLPSGKAAHVAALARAGRKVLMVGDGLNDTPALMAAHASMAPASAADVGRNAADLVFLRENLSAVPQAIAVAREAGRLVRQNLALAIAYNVVAVPVAIMGHVTPLIAAVAMSGSSIVVVANALRLRGLGGLGTRRAKEAANRPASTMLEAAE